jgi:hypothetical protein
MHDLHELVTTRKAIWLSGGFLLNPRAAGHMAGVLTANNTIDT